MASGRYHPKFEWHALAQTCKRRGRANQRRPLVAAATGSAACLNRDSRIALRSNRTNSNERGAGPAGWRQTLLAPGILPDIQYRRALLEDREGNIWLATELYGLYRLRGRRIEVLSVEEGLAARDVYPILQTKDGAVWIGTIDHGLCRYFNGQFTSFLAGFITSIGEDREGRLWVSGNPYRQLNGRLVQVAGGVGMRQESRRRTKTRGA
jgi:hypothetical protein